MDSLQQQIIQGIPPGWLSFTPRLSLPDNVLIVHAATDQKRRILFMRVDGHIRTVMPLFDLNSEIRRLGAEAVWLFEGNAIPSTKHMVCLAIQWCDGQAMGSIVNLDQSSAETTQLFSVAQLSQAFAEGRLKVLGINVGQRVSVTCTTDQIACAACGATTNRLSAASFNLAGAERAPRLSLTSRKLGMCLSRLIAAEIREQFPALSIGGELSPPDCCACRSGGSVPVLRPVQNSRATGSIVISSLAALELQRHYKSAWCIA